MQHLYNKCIRRVATHLAKLLYMRGSIASEAQDHSNRDANFSDSATHAREWHKYN